MIHTIIYENRQFAGGYDLYRSSDQFPTDMIRDIRTVCEYANSAGNIGQSYCLRCQPLKNRYLLSVIVRQSQGNDYSSRSVHQIVNFLMDDEEACRLLDLPFAQTWPQLIQHVNGLLASPYDCLPGGLPFLDQAPDPAYKPDHRFSQATLLAAASYCRSNAKPRSQAYFGTDGDLLADIDMLMQCLPRKLRKDISFQVGILNVSESAGTALNFNTMDIIAKMQQNDFMGGPSSNKYVYYPGAYSGSSYVFKPDSKAAKEYGAIWQALQELPFQKLLLQCINSWEDFQKLGMLAVSKNYHTAALKLVPQEELIAALKQMKPDYSLLLTLYDAAPKRYKKFRNYLISAMSKAQLASSAEQSSHTNNSRPNKRKNRTAPLLATRLIPSGKLLTCLLGCLLGLSVLFVFLKKLIDLAVTTADAQLNITISLAHSIGLLELAIAFLLGVILSQVFFQLFKEIDRLFRKK